MQQWSLEELTRDTRRLGAEGSAVLTRDGSMVVDDLPVHAFAESVCAMAAAVYASGESVLSGTKGGKARRIWIQGNGHDALVEAIDAQSLFLLFVPSGMDLVEIEARIAESIRA